MEIQYLFELATAEETELIKRLLTRYKKMKNELSVFESNPPDTDKQRAIVNYNKRITRNLERAVNAIYDSEIREVIHFRFIEGNPRWATLIRFNTPSESTVDRMIKEGIKNVADSLKLWGEI